MSNIPSNYHTHSTFCDGKDTPEEMVLEAIRLGCPEIGFSGHSYTDFDETYCMSIEGTKQYKKCIRELAEKYRDRIRILLGVEQDYFSNAPTNGYDYVIGSVHYIKKDGAYLTVDESAETQKRDVANHYGLSAIPIATTKTICSAVLFESFLRKNGEISVLKCRGRFFCVRRRLHIAQYAQYNIASVVSHRNDTVSNSVVLRYIPYPAVKF